MIRIVREKGLREELIEKGRIRRELVQLGPYSRETVGFHSAGAGSKCLNHFIQKGLLKQDVMKPAEAVLPGLFLLQP